MASNKIGAGSYGSIFVKRITATLFLSWIALISPAAAATGRTDNVPVVEIDHT
jgi:hypothetical protein